MSAPLNTPPELSPEDALVDRVKEVHRFYPTGVTIVTSEVDGEPFGLAVNAFSSLSLAPPMVLVCLAATATSYPKFFLRDHMAINILAFDQDYVAARLGTSDPRKFDSVEWHLGEHGAPLLAGAAATLELWVETRIPAYTHTIFVGRVVNAERHDRPPLVYMNRQFFDSTPLLEQSGAGN
ncbi:Nitrilotriacetate monooxygenase component B [Rhodococcus wratislaviensis]|uniref:Nitrilotriacetate monooxygenase component B n=1 Tax=Rhodococcus wratislaviensis TaxID=44752 RepID=A0A402CL12_RHOWR|nr:flavin reductase family protein [Rhodococcus wratislaviensis]GCE44229.1 Nitrilotriacetate monooxygenase component B [Rhodococcus wratislaviensis]